MLDELRSPGLYGKIGLGKYDLLLLGIAILGVELAGITGEHDIVDFSLAARPKGDHFVDVNKMVLD